MNVKFVTISFPHQVIYRDRKKLTMETNVMNVMLTTQVLANVLSLVVHPTSKKSLIIFQRGRTIII